MQARQTIIDGASREDAKRLLESFDMAWQALEQRSADPETVSAKVAHYTLLIGRVRPELEPAELAMIVLQMFD